jgi:hypothetical protein
MTLWTGESLNRKGVGREGAPDSALSKVFKLLLYNGVKN